MVRVGVVVACAAFTGTSLFGCSRIRPDGFTTTTSTTGPGGCKAPQKYFEGKGCFYKCESDLSLPIVASSQKGLTLDDTTLHWCPGNLHFQWPNTDEPVTSFRMFKAWAEDWNEQYAPAKDTAWQELARYLNATQAKVLLGTQISCNETEDDEDWENVKKILKIFGPEHTMGLAVGNELELLWTQGDIIGKDVLPGCLDRVWNKNYFQNKFLARVNEMDALAGGFASIPVTSVFGGAILAQPGSPFYEMPTGDRLARPNTFLAWAKSTYGERYVHTLNVYPYFDTQAQMDPNGKTCQQELDKAMCFKTDDPNKCLFTSMISRMRERLEVMGNADSTLWIGETGWSSPQAQTLSAPMTKCAEFSSTQSLAEYYSNFLKWDMAMQGRYKGPDHVFYFSMRDSSNFGKTEGFGLVGGGDAKDWCTNTTCKLQRSSRTGVRTTTAQNTSSAMAAVVTV